MEPLLITDFKRAAYMQYRGATPLTPFKKGNAIYFPFDGNDPISEIAYDDYLLSEYKQVSDVYEACINPVVKQLKPKKLR